MADDEERPPALSRKTFVALSSIGLTAAGLAACNPAPSGNGASQGGATPGPGAATGSPAAGGPLASEPEAYVFFVDPERSFIEAAVERLIPSDESGPGAREAGVAFFIDQQLVGQYGYAAKMYMQGPWGIGTPEQGYQLPLTPREVYRIGVSETNDYCRHTYGGKTFDQLPPDQQDATLLALQKGDAHLPSFPAPVFFQMLFDNTVEGFFADPLYGGNRDMIGWKLVGFPGVAADYRNAIPSYVNKAYTVAPVSIAGVQQQMQAEMQSSPAPQASATASAAPEVRGTAADHTPLRIVAMRNSLRAQRGS